ncbi:hypothetical protein [Pseudomonas extremaustralis]
MPELIPSTNLHRVIQAVFDWSDTHLIVESDGMSQSA